MADKRFFKNCGPIKLKKIIEATKSVMNKNINQDLLLYDVAFPSTAKDGEITVIHHTKYLNDLYSTKASVCFISEKYINYANQDTILLISDNPHKAYSIAASLFYPEEYDNIISSHAIIDDNAEIGDNCSIGANSVIESGAKIGDNSIIGINSFIARNVIIGDNCRIHNNVNISHSIIGNDTIIHSGAIIGKAGFGFASDISGHYHTPQLGRVIIGNNVLIGANSCIDRGSIGDTIISDHCMIDNLVQIGHNVQLGKGCILVSMVGIAGSTKFGDFVAVGGQVGIAGHLNIGSYSQIAAGSGVIKDIGVKQVCGGYPAIPIKKWHRQSVILKKLVDNNKSE